MGPDIVSLGENEAYEIDVDAFGNVSGVCVRDIFTGRILWHLSGAVVLLPGVRPHGLPSISLEDLDVSVGFEEAKSFAKPRLSHFCASLIFYLAQLSALFVLMAKYEPTLDPSGLPWWRAVFSVPGGFLFGCGVNPHYWGRCLTGTLLPPKVVLLSGVVASALFSIAVFVPAVHYEGQPHTWPLFSIAVIGTAAYLLFAVPVHCVCAFLKLRRVSVKPAACTDIGGVCSDKPTEWAALPSTRRFAVTSHVYWTLWQTAGSFGTWILMYLVALGYVALEARSTMMAGIYLTLATSSIEVGIAAATQFVYEHLVYFPRCSAVSKEEMFGDQKVHVMSPICFTHSYAESTRLASTVAVVARDPSWSWIATVTMFFTANIAHRRGFWSACLMKLVPESLQGYVKPGCSAILHREARFHYGYPRFVPVAAVVIANLLVHGLQKPVFFNTQTLTMVLCMFVLEVLEDFLVVLERLPRDIWRQFPDVQESFAQFGILHPRQLLLVDRNGCHAGKGPLALHGMRFLNPLEVAGTMAPACYFCHTLITLLLGAGFVHGVCEAPIPSQSRIGDGLMWQSPLRCI